MTNHEKGGQQETTLYRRPGRKGNRAHKDAMSPENRAILEARVLAHQARVEAELAKREVQSH